MNIKRILFLLLGFLSCSPPITDRIEILVSPIIIIIKTDTAIVVRDTEGIEYTLNTSDRIDYRVHFLNVGDTINIK